MNNSDLKVLGVFRKFERLVLFALSILLALVILGATIDLFITVGKDVFSPPWYLLSVEGLLEIAGLFLLILLMVELLETVKAYLSERVFHLEVVMAVGLIALGRKVIVLDYTKVDPLALFGLAALVISLAVSYFLIRRITCPPGQKNPIADALDPCA